MCRFELMDVTPPVLTCVDRTQLIRACNGTITWCDPVGISDNCPLDFPGFNPVMQVSGPSKGTVQPIGIYDIGYKAVDLAGNEGFCTFKLYLIDELPPTLDQPCMAPIVVNIPDGLCCGIANWTNPRLFLSDWNYRCVDFSLISAHTNCDSALKFIYSLPSGYCFPIGTTVVTLLVEDVVLRSATCSFTVTVIDNRPPPVICVPPQNVHLPCGPAFQYYEQNAGLAK